jgi:cysteinyl-tRNA synthetase
MELKLYDTLTREKRVFAPIDPQRVRMYVCGPTVYDFAHIGNARPVIVFDVLFRLLRHLAKQGVWDGGKGETAVTYVRNITDVDDKINARAAVEYPDLPLNEAIRKVTEKTDRQFHEDVAALGCLPPTVEPRATEHIAEMRTLIERLVESGNAYVAEDNVLFSVPSMPDYGRLSKRPLDEMIAGARVDVAPYKHDPMDFVLWKPSKPGEPAWPSPCGIAAPGRPGWHIECSAMSWKHLGEVFDIHGGGIDLVFPHHENEIAQSRCAFHTGVMANYWMHNGFLQVEGEKMSKSLGNFVTIRELLAQQPNNRWWGEILRFNMLRTHYRQPIDWTQSSLNESLVVYSNLQRAVALANRNKAKPSEAILSALTDDLNTPAVMTELHKLAVEARSASGAPADAANELLGSLVLLGFERAVEHAKSEGVREDIIRAIQEVKAREQDLDPASLDQQVAARTAARKAKNFAEADRIRDELAAMGVVLKDTKDSTTWEIAR